MPPAPRRRRPRSSRESKSASSKPSRSCRQRRHLPVWFSRSTCMPARFCARMRMMLPPPAIWTSQRLGQPISPMASRPAQAAPAEWQSRCNVGPSLTRRHP
eukprot:8397670-Lingulodinium_polyedra.AAC.1